MQVNTAVIVAAGMGTRLGDEGPPKPLVPLAGVPLIARVMHSAARAGITKFVVVTGYRAAEVADAARRLLPRGSSLTIVENPRYREPNGVSLLEGVRSVKGPFVLLMSDHIFSPERLASAKGRFEKTSRPLLVVERAADFKGDMEDATLVLEKGGRVAAIGKGLREYNAVDTGMFVLDPEKTEKALCEAGPAPSISSAMAVMAGAGELDALYVNEGYWQDVDTPGDIAAAEEKLMRSLQKPSDGMMAKLVNRRISLFLTSRLFRLGVTPNMVTAFTLLLGLLSGAAFAMGATPFWGLLGASLFQAHSIIDGVDGELARLLLKESDIGFWFDVTTDNVTHMAVFAGIALGQMSGGVPGPWFILAVLAVAGVGASFIAMAPFLRPGSGPRRDKRDGLRRTVEALASRDFSYLLFPLAALGLLGKFLWVVVAGTWIYALMVFLARIRRARAG